jgi:hypothetical protein
MKMVLIKPKAALGYVKAIYKVGVLEVAVGKIDCAALCSVLFGVPDVAGPEPHEPVFHFLVLWVTPEGTKPDFTLKPAIFERPAPEIHVLDPFTLEQAVLETWEMEKATVQLASFKNNVFETPRLTGEVFKPANDDGCILENYINKVGPLKKTVVKLRPSA